MAQEKLLIRKGKNKALKDENTEIRGILDQVENRIHEIENDCKQNHISVSMPPHNTTREKRSLK